MPSGWKSRPTPRARRLLSNRVIGLALPGFGVGAESRRRRVSLRVGDVGVFGGVAWGLLGEVPGGAVVVEAEVDESS